MNEVCATARLLPVHVQQHTAVQYAHRDTAARCNTVCRDRRERERERAGEREREGGMEGGRGMEKREREREEKGER